MDYGERLDTPTALPRLCIGSPSPTPRSPGRASPRFGHPAGSSSRGPSHVASLRSLHMGDGTPPPTAGSVFSANSPRLPHLGRFAEDGSSELEREQRQKRGVLLKMLLQHERDVAKKPGGHYALFHEGRLNPHTRSTLRLPATSKRYSSAREKEAVTFGGAFGRKLWRF